MKSFFYYKGSDLKESEVPYWAAFQALDKDGFMCVFSHSPKPTNSGWACCGLKERVDYIGKREIWHQTLRRV